jgi:osmotically-inducible protein OsmY
MSWRAAGVQFYPGGAYETMQELSRRAHGDQQRPQNDSQRRGSFRGLGPKGYVRSDARLQELICERLTDDEYIDARGVSVEVKDCEVTLSGTVPVRQQKYAIEDVVAEISGVAEIHNRLNVDDAEIDERMSGL